MTDTKQSTEENDVIKQFMELLNQQNMGGAVTGLHGAFQVCGGYAATACCDGGRVTERQTAA